MATGLSSFFPALPILFILSNLFLLVPVVSFVRGRNGAVLFYVFWIFVGNSVFFVNMLIWRGNVANRAAVYCDIVTKVMVMVPIGIACSLMSINRLVWNISRSSKLTLGDIKARNIKDSVICIGFPILFGALHTLVQDKRFTIIEDVGCLPSTSRGLAALFFYYLPPSAICCGAASIYCVLAVIRFWQGRRHVNEFGAADIENNITNPNLNSNTNSSSNVNSTSNPTARPGSSSNGNSNAKAMTSNRYIRLVLLCTTSFILCATFLLGVLFTNLQIGINSSASWSNSTWDFKNIETITRADLDSPTFISDNANTNNTSNVGHFVHGSHEKNLLLFTLLPLPILALHFFLFFGFGNEAVKSYQATRQSIITPMMTTFRNSRFPDSMHSVHEHVVFGIARSGSSTSNRSRRTTESRRSTGSNEFNEMQEVHGWNGWSGWRKAIKSNGSFASTRRDSHASTSSLKKLWHGRSSSIPSLRSVTSPTTSQFQPPPPVPPVPQSFQLPVHPRPLKLVERVAQKTGEKADQTEAVVLGPPRPEYFNFPPPPENSPPPSLIARARKSRGKITQTSTSTVDTATGIPSITPLSPPPPPSPPSAPSPLVPPPSSASNVSNVTNAEDIVVAAEVVSAAEAPRKSIAPTLTNSIVWNPFVSPELALPSPAYLAPMRSPLSPKFMVSSPMSPNSFQTMQSIQTSHTIETVQMLPTPQTGQTFYGPELPRMPPVPEAETPPSGQTVHVPRLPELQLSPRSLHLKSLKSFKSSYSLAQSTMDSSSLQPPTSPKSSKLLQPPSPNLLQPTSPISMRSSKRNSARSWRSGRSSLSSLNVTFRNFPMPPHHFLHDYASPTSVDLNFLNLRDDRDDRPHTAYPSYPSYSSYGSEREKEKDRMGGHPYAPYALEREDRDVPRDRKTRKDSTAKSRGQQTARTWPERRHSKDDREGRDVIFRGAYTEGVDEDAASSAQSRFSIWSDDSHVLERRVIPTDTKSSGFFSWARKPNMSI